jgi:PIN domain nuclease of toxin-antitoxin system
MSIWELSLLDAKRRISLNAPCLAWVRTALDRSGVLSAPLNPEIAVESNHCPAGSIASRSIASRSRPRASRA